MSTGLPVKSRVGVQAAAAFAFLFFCGLAGVYLRSGEKTPAPAEAPPAAPKKYPLLLAAADFGEGREIKESDFYMTSVSKEERDRLIGSKSSFAVSTQLVGRVLKTPVKMGEPFFLDCVYMEGTGPTPADLLTDGMRAVTVSVNLVGGLRGFVAPSTWVDVMFRRRAGSDAPESTRAARTHTIFSGVRVLAIQDSLYPATLLPRDARGAAATNFEVTLELTPQQCEVLKSVEDRGELSLNMLPTLADRQNAGEVPDAALMKILLGVEDPPVAPAAPPPSVRIIRGGAATSIAVQDQADVIVDQHLYPAPPPRTVPLVPDAVGPAEPDADWPKSGGPADSASGSSPAGTSAQDPLPAPAGPDAFRRRGSPIDSIIVRNGRVVPRQPLLTVSRSIPARMPSAHTPRTFGLAAEPVPQPRTSSVPSRSVRLNSVSNRSLAGVHGIVPLYKSGAARPDYSPATGGVGRVAVYGGGLAGGGNSVRRVASPVPARMPARHRELVVLRSGPGQVPAPDYSGDSRRATAGRR